MCGPRLPVQHLQGPKRRRLHIVFVPLGHAGFITYIVQHLITCGCCVVLPRQTAIGRYRTLWLPTHTNHSHSRNPLWAFSRRTGAGQRRQTRVAAGRRNQGLLSASPVFVTFFPCFFSSRPSSRVPHLNSSPPLRNPPGRRLYLATVRYPARRFRYLGLRRYLWRPHLPCSPNTPHRVSFLPVPTAFLLPLPYCHFRSPLPSSREPERLAGAPTE